MRLSQAETAQIMQTLIARHDTRTGRDILRHHAAASIDMFLGEHYFQNWQNAAKALVAPQQEMHERVCQKQQIAREARHILAQTHRLLRKTGLQTPLAMTSRADAAILDNLNHIKNLCEKTPNLLGRRNLDQVNHITEKLSAALELVDHSRRQCRRLQTEAMTHETEFRQWFDPAAKQLRQVIRTHFTQQQDHLFQWFALDLHLIRQRERDNSYRARKRSQKAETTADCQTCPKCQGTGKIIPFKPRNLAKPQPAQPQIAPNMAQIAPTTTPPAQPSPQTIAPFNPESGQPATPEQFAKLMAASDLWKANTAARPFYRPEWLQQGLELLWRTPRTNVAVFKSITGRRPEGFVLTLADLINVPGLFETIMKVDLDDGQIILNRELLQKTYQLPESIMGRSSPNPETSAA